MTVRVRGRGRGRDRVRVRVRVTNELLELCARAEGGIGRLGKADQARFEE